MQSSTLVLQVLQALGGFGVAAACLRIMYVGMNGETNRFVRHVFVAILVMGFAFGVSAFALKPAGLVSSLFMLAAAGLLLYGSKEIIALLLDAEGAGHG